MFLEKIYMGDFDQNMFRAPGPFVDRARVGAIVEAYGQILKDYSSRMPEAEGLLSPEVLRKMGEAGFFGLSIDRRYGGQGLNLLEYLEVVEEMAKLDNSVAFTFLAHLSIGVKAVQLYGNEAQKRKYLTPAASGEMIFAYALTEPHIGSDARHVETTALLASDGTHYILNGQKAYITNANYAGGLTVFAQLDLERPGFMGAFLVETGWDGVVVGKEMPKMGLTASSTAAIRFKNVRVPVENLVGNPGDGFRIAVSVLNYGRLGLGASSAALMKVSARDMLKRASSRVQFQVPIKSFQLIQEKIVRAEVNAAVSSAMNVFTAGMLHAEPFQNTAIETSHCKLFGTTRAWEAAYDGLQVAGGAGYLKTHPYEKRMRDSRVTTVFEGTTEIHSIYPALFGLRRMAEWLKESGRGPLGKVIGLVKFFSGRSPWPVPFKNGPMRGALEEARKNARFIRILLAASLLFHGKSIARGMIAEREYLLRRIGTLSLYLFGLLALLAEASKKEQSGNLQEKDARIIDYFAAEARETRRLNWRFFDSKKEKLGSALFHDLDRDLHP